MYTETKNTALREQSSTTHFYLRSSDGRTVQWQKNKLELKIEAGWVMLFNSAVSHLLGVSKWLSVLTGFSWADKILGTPVSSKLDILTVVESTFTQVMYVNKW